MEKGISKTTGLIIGKFFPLHLGHQYLIDFALQYVDRLTILVCTLNSESIDGYLRYEWVKESFPKAHVIHSTDENPQEPHEHPDFWNIWENTIKSRVPEKIDYVFASEQYGFKLAEMLSAKYIPVNHSRSLIPVSGTKIRKNPMKYWKYIHPNARPYFVKKVCIFGPESTGKTVLTQKLAKKFKTVYCEEYARGLIDLSDNKVTYSTISDIAKGHPASEKALLKQANRVLFSDTDLIITKIWSKILFKKYPKWIEKKIQENTYDLYLLTDIDTPYFPDPQRYLPTKRKWFLNICIRELKKYNRNYHLISGNWLEREKKAISAVKKILT